MYCAIKTKIMAKKTVQPHTHTLIYTLTQTTYNTHTETRTHAICAAFGGLFHAANCNIGDLALYFVCNGAYTWRCECVVCVCQCVYGAYAWPCVFIVRFFICILLGCVKAFKHIISIAEHNTKGLTLISTYDLWVCVPVNMWVCWCLCIHIAVST